MIMARGFLMIDIKGKELTSADKKILCEPNVGGVILFSRNYESLKQITELVDEIRKLKSPSLLIAVDHEGGRVQRFHGGFTLIPPMRQIGRIYDIKKDEALDLSRKIGWLIGSELRSIGIDLSFSPCVDLDWGLSSVIGDRSFHQNKFVVESLSYEYSKGMLSSGMSPVAKHFPGHGAVTTDSHLDLPIDRRDFSALLDDIYPYECLARKRVMPAVMMSHVVFSEADNFPASISDYWINDHLRKQINYNGVVFCDDLTMKALDKYGGSSECAMKALKAGCDMLLVCNDRENAKKIIHSTKNYNNYSSMVRLASIVGKKSYTNEELVRSEKWIEAKSSLEKLNLNPEFELEI